ncbi:hypothetical protein [Streptomyces abyssalis]|uniref:hypothetical protein n=1 Tax=Streptomyces abyssalis TaxID=933944 RepID=UPI001112DC6C|nr:hypothetical protein [Streptomyces abyssalis]
MPAAVWKPSTAAASPRKWAFHLEDRTFPNLFQELTMADVAFVVTMIAVFALVAVIAKGVAKL